MSVDLNGKFDLRKLPTKHRDSLSIGAKIEGKWISFYDVDSKSPITKRSPYVFGAIIKPNSSKRSSSVQKLSIFPDSYQIYQSKLDSIEEHQNLKLEPAEIPLANKSRNLSSVQLVQKNIKND